MQFLCKDIEDPEVWCSKRNGNVPVYLEEKRRCYLIVGKGISAEMDETWLEGGVLALLASSYLLDFDSISSLSRNCPN